MAILISQNTNVVIQGMTGQEGQRIFRAMRDYGTKVSAGVTPGKGGQDVDGVPVFTSVAEAIQKFPDTNTSVVSVPPARARDAVLEAIESGIRLIHVIVENIPLRDTAYFLSVARAKGVRIVGPASIGIIAPGIGRVGIIGGFDPNEIYEPGPIGIISRSGGMANELAWMIRQAGLGQSTAVGIGGDYLIGTTYGDLLQEFERDPETKGIIIFGELGGRHEYEIIELREKGLISKPIAIHIAGRFAETLPIGTSFGHAGSIVERGMGSVRAKESALAKAGILVAEDVYDLPELIRDACKI
jgi:succinyl-CoA synthetase alpha subunit